MTWSKAESDIIEALTKQSAATAENVREIKEAIVGSLLNGGKPGLQDKVRDLSAGMDRLSTEFIIHKKGVKETHFTIKRSILGIGMLAIIALILSFDRVVPYVGSLIKLVVKLLT